jgi:hypothetical protein
VITWGGNLAGVNLTLSKFISDYEAEHIEVTASQDVAPEIDGNVSVADAIKIAALQAKDPVLYPLFSAIVSLIAVTGGTISILTIYELFFFALAVGAFFLLGKFGHLSIVVGGVWVIFGFATAWGVYDWWVIAVAVIAGLGFIISQGRQAL